MTEKTPINKYPPPFSMRFTEDERKTLELAAADRPLGAYIRWLIFKEEMPFPKEPSASNLCIRSRYPLHKMRMCLYLCLKTR